VAKQVQEWLLEQKGLDFDDVAYAFGDAVWMM
jgi:hypothetical protein